MVDGEAMTSNRSGSWVRAWAAAALGLAPAGIAHADDAIVTIAGGADASGHYYTWTVTSAASSPIVYVEFPEYRSDLFQPPPGWSEQSTGVGVRAAAADGAASAIQRGRSADFILRIRPGGAQRGIGTVRIRFADGSESIVAGVEVPTVPSDRNIGLIGMAVLFAGWIAIRAVRRRRTRPEAAESS